MGWLRLPLCPSGLKRLARKTTSPSSRQLINFPNYFSEILLRIISAGCLFLFFIAIQHNREVQKTAQAGIDRVLGKDRLPSLTDRVSLSCVEGAHKEVFGWTPLDPIGLPHRYPGTALSWGGGGSVVYLVVNCAYPSYV